MSLLWRGMGSAPRMALQYGLLFGALGISLPFAGLWFWGQGLTGAQIGLLLAVPMLARLATGPLIAVWADGFRHRRSPIAWLALAAAGGTAATGLVEGWPAWTATWLVAATASAAMIPLSDVLGLRVARRGGHSYSRPRGFGSAAFVLANVVMGAVLVRSSVDAVIVAVTAINLAIAFVAWRVLPAEPVGEGVSAHGWERFRGMGRLVLDPVLMTALLAVGALQASHAFYYGFSAILWRSQGIDPGLTGWLWGFSVVLETLFMWFAEPWRRRYRIGPWVLLTFGAVGGIVRWSAMAMGPEIWMLWPLQVLHTLTFAGTFLAGVEFVERLAPAKSHTAAQTLSSMLSAGVLIGLATLTSGPLYDAFGAGGYWAMAGLSLLGLGAALALRPALARRSVFSEGGG